MEYYEIALGPFILTQAVTKWSIRSSISSNTILLFFFKLNRIVQEGPTAMFRSRNEYFPALKL